MAVDPVILTLSASGEKTAHDLAAKLGLRVHGRSGRVQKADAFFDNALDHARDLFAAGVPIIGVCASAILVRAVAPLLANKRAEPPVLSVAEDGSVVVPLLGGHYGANRLARDIAEVLGSVAAVTTAGDVAIGVALDEPPAGWCLENPQEAKPVMAALLAGGGASLSGDALDEATWLHDIPKGDAVNVVASMAPVRAEANQLVFRPQRVTLGVGCARNCPPQELAELVERVLQDASISATALRGVFSLDVKADEPAVQMLAENLGLDARFFDAAALEQETPRLANPSDVVFAEVGCHGVSEAAALSAAGPDGRLLAAKVKTKNATAALAIAPQPIVELAGRARGRLSVVGIGPGQATWRTPEASRLIAEADELVGYGLYIDLLGPLAAGKPRSDFPLGGEEARCRYALEQAATGKNVALICSGDAGIYAMGALVFELLDRPSDEKGVSDAARRVDVINAPGVSALQGAAARAGAPLGHDFCAISLSDLLTPRDDILRRLKAASEGDFVVAFYNPVSKRRRTLLAEARDILLENRPADTPVMLASSLGRPEEHVRYCRLDELNVDDVDMLTVVLVGSSHSRLAQLGEGPRMFTPRGYARKIDGDLAREAS